MAVPAGRRPWARSAGSLSPYGSVLNLTVTFRNGFYEIQGFEAQCGGNLSLPVTGLAVPQANGTIFFGLTSINENGQGLHTRAYINTSNFNGSWADNAGNFNQPFRLQSRRARVPGGPRTGPTQRRPGRRQVRRHTLARASTPG